jgi:hypothetical protein
VTSRANRLKAETIEAKECLHHWMTNDVLDANLELGRTLKEGLGLSK